GVSSRFGTVCGSIPVRSPSPSMARDGPEPARHTPSPKFLCQFRGAKILALSQRKLHLCFDFSLVRHAVRAWVGGGVCRDRVRHGCRTRAYREVFTACPGRPRHPPRPRTTSHPATAKKSTQRSTTHTKRLRDTRPDTHAKIPEKLIQRMTTRGKVVHLFITDHLTRHLPGTFQAINQAERQCFLARPEQPGKHFRMRLGIQALTTTGFHRIDKLHMDGIEHLLHMLLLCFIHRHERIKN